MENPFLPKNQHEALSALLNAEVRFLIVGGYAFSAHAFIRATKDVDVWVEPTPENAKRVWAALATFGTPLTSHSITPPDFQTPDLIYQVGVQPQRVDILTTVPGVVFEEAWARRIEADIGGGLQVPVLGLEDLIRAKETANRPQDQLDMQALRRVVKSKKGEAE